jgi:hypothetical protein
VFKSLFSSKSFAGKLFSFSLHYFSKLLLAPIVISRLLVSAAATGADMVQVPRCLKLKKGYKHAGTKAAKPLSLNRLIQIILRQSAPRSA